MPTVWYVISQWERTQKKACKKSQNTDEKIWIRKERVDVTMSAKSINRDVIGILRKLSDDKNVTVVQNKHIKVVGVYGGITRSFMLSTSPSSQYRLFLRSQLARFIQSLNVKTNITYPFI